VIWELRHEYKITELINVSALPRSTYYYYTKQSTKPDKYAEMKQQITAIYEAHKRRFGYRQITLELHNRRFHINHKTVQRLMHQLGLFCRVRMKRYNSYRGEVGVVASNLLERNFTADRPNEKWVTDVTEFSMFGQKLYLSPVLDLYNREIVSYCISDHAHFSQIVGMLEQALQKIPDNTNLILHSDQGWQYQMKLYQRMLKAKGIRQSMSRKGNCLDNAVIENFFGILKTELLYLQEFTSMAMFKKELIEYLDYYNNYRIKQKLKGMSPVQYRIHTLQTA
jgi:putative transposase